MSGRGIDPARCRIVLFGSFQYEDERLADVPQIAANLRDLAAVLTDPQIGGFPSESCITLPPQATIRDVGQALGRAAKQAEDLLLFYFAGHGITTGRPRALHLALHDTDVDAVGYSALRFETVRETFVESPARNRVVILDSCFSGLAIGTTLAADEQEVLGQLEINGTYTLASAPPNETAQVLSGETHTAFTGRLLTLLREGSPSAGLHLTLQDIYQHLHARLRAESLPLPQQVGTESSARLGLAHNRITTTPTSASLPVSTKTTTALIALALAKALNGTVNTQAPAPKATARAASSYTVKAAAALAGFYTANATVAAGVLLGRLRGAARGREANGITDEKIAEISRIVEEKWRKG